MSYVFTGFLPPTVNAHCLTNGNVYFNWTLQQPFGNLSASYLQRLILNSWNINLTCTDQNNDVIKVVHSYWLSYTHLLLYIYRFSMEGIRQIILKRSQTTTIYPVILKFPMNIWEVFSHHGTVLVVMLQWKVHNVLLKQWATTNNFQS